MVSLGPCGSRRGSWYRRSRVMPVEGRGPGSGVLLREVETGQCRKARTQIRQVPPEEAVWQGQAGNARSRTRGARQSATPRACPAVKPVREPDAGDPQVRFDERRWETEPRPRLRHRRSGESRRKQLLPRPTDTAPAADSTLERLTNRPNGPGEHSPGLRPKADALGSRAPPPGGLKGRESLQSHT
jgi:hypothetical protein